MSRTNNNSEIGFHTRFRGYDIRQVDKCLDELTGKIKKYEGYITQLDERNRQLETEKINEYNEYLDNARELAQKKIDDAEKAAQSIITQARQKVMAAEHRLRQIEQQTDDSVADAQQSIMKMLAFSGKVKQSIDQTFADIQNNSNFCLDSLEKLSALPTRTENSYNSGGIVINIPDAE